MENSVREQVLGDSILSQLQHKCRKIDEIYNLTKDISEVLQQNDSVSRDMLLSMRLESMIDVDEINKELQISVDRLPSESREHMYTLFQKGDLDTNIEWEIKVKKEYFRLRNVLNKTISLDKEISLKIAGSKSFYSEKAT